MKLPMKRQVNESKKLTEKDAKNEREKLKNENCSLKKPIFT